MAFFDNSNVRIHYETYGRNGSWVVLINGYTRPCSDFKQFARFLEKNSYRVLLFDNRGAGKTIFSSPFSLEDIASDLYSLTDFLGVEEFHLVGFSMGGIISRVFTHRHPEKVKSLCLVSSPSKPSFLLEQKRSQWGKTLEEIEKKLSLYVSEGFMKKNSLLMKGMAKGIFTQIRDGFLEKSREQKEAVERTGREFYSIRELKQSILILHGFLDKIIPIESAQDLKKTALKAKVTIFDDAGHLLLIENTKELYKSIYNFLEEKNDQSFL